MEFFRRFECLDGDVYPRLKFIYYALLDADVAQLPLYESQRLLSIIADERSNHRFANTFGALLDEFIASNCSPKAVDNWRDKFPP